MKTAFLIASILLLASACGKKNHSGSSKPETHTDPYHSRLLEVTQKETVTFKRQEQIVSRYNCQGHITSRKLETQNSLSKKITVNYENRKKAYSYSVYNRRTKSAQMGAFVTEGKFVVDYAPTVFNMRVKAGINDVEYIFNRCALYTQNPQGQTVCSKIELEIEGIVQIDVTYSAETLPGEQHLHPTPESCKPTTP